MCLGDGMPKKTVFSLSLSRGTVHATSVCQTEVKKNTVSKYHFPFPKSSIVVINITMGNRI